MLNFSRKSYSQKSRQQVGPVIIAVLFLLAACGISIDFFAGQILGARELLSELDTTAKSEISQRLSTEGLTDPTSTSLPLSDPLPRAHDWKARPVGRSPASDAPEDELGIVRNRQYATPEFSLEAKTEDYKINLSPSRWKGNAQLLPSPMLVSQLHGKHRLEIRGGGWLAIDIARSRIFPVELYKGQTGPNPLIEAKRLDGREVVSPKNTGFPIVRGIPEIREGGFEVFENPPCLVRFGAVAEDEICDVTLRGAKIRYRFDRTETGLSRVWIDGGLGHWLEIGTFNDGFHPIGDPNRDGYPDFYAETITGLDESGTQMLFMSRLRDDSIEYDTYETPFQNAR